MAKMTGRMKLLAFMGGMEVVFGFVLVYMGSTSIALFNHGAVGVAMWAGILIIMVGLGNLLLVAGDKPKRSNEPQSLNLRSTMLNLIGLILACVLLGFYIWGAYDPVLKNGPSSVLVPSQAVYTYGDLVSLAATVIAMALILLIMSLAVLMADCCGFLMAGMPGPPPPALSASPHRDYGHSPMYNGDPYNGLPPAAMYKR